MGSRDASQSVFLRFAVGGVFGARRLRLRGRAGEVRFLRVLPKCCHLFFKEINELI